MVGFVDGVGFGQEGVVVRGGPGVCQSTVFADDGHDEGVGDAVEVAGL